MLELVKAAPALFVVMETTTGGDPAALDRGMVCAVVVLDVTTIEPAASVAVKTTPSADPASLETSGFKVLALVGDEPAAYEEVKTTTADPAGVETPGFKVLASVGIEPPASEIGI